MDRKRFESSLPHMSGAVVVTVVPPDMRSHQPLHPTAQITVLVKDGVAGVTKVQNVVTNVSSRGSCGSGHGNIVPRKQLKYNVPIVFGTVVAL